MPMIGRWHLKRLIIWCVASRGFEAYLCACRKLPMQLRKCISGKTRIFEASLDHAVFAF